MKKITNRQREIFDFIYEHILNDNRPPTILEIKNHFGLASNQGVIDHLTALERKGYLKRQKRSRGIILLKRYREPFPILGQVPAGTPFSIEEYHEGNLKLEELFDSEKCYVIRVKGDSMKEAGIFDQDFVIVRHQEKVEHGEIGIVVIDGEVTVKRILFKNKKIILQPENKNYSPIVIDPDRSQAFICGKVVGVIRKL